MHRVLRPVVAGGPAPWFGPDLGAVDFGEEEFVRLDGNRRQFVGEAQLDEFANRVRLEVDAQPERLEFGSSLIHPDRDVQLVARERNGEPGDPSTSDDHVHEPTVARRRSRLSMRRSRSEHETNGSSGNAQPPVT